MAGCKASFIQRFHLYIVVLGVGEVWPERCSQRGVVWSKRCGVVEEVWSGRCGQRDSTSVVLREVWCGRRGVVREVWSERFH